ncbi:2,3-bisphosphoglycerate-independent phosphoglycerate mutase [Candidatus Peregrinibacteria bacterium]|nr:2,3-bisphosphoglycerate-independent phosphoglycerate mutase [Candidatus Peregrinibacteria bacterium]
MNKALLIILDGYGEGRDYKYNAVTRANTPFLDKLRERYPSTLLNASGKSVGLPKNSMGGSEVGHFTMGAGRIVYQSLEEINRSIKSKEFFSLPALKKAAENCKKNDSAFHILGMISDEGVHSHLDHLFALLDFAKKEKLKKVYIHAITDGRDVEERSAEEFITKINAKIKKTGLGRIATIIGRFYAMDRDKNFKRTKKAYDLYTLGKGTKEKSALQAIKNEYKRGTETDYYIEPIILNDEGIIKNEDSVVFFNYRTDRAAQITAAFTEKSFKAFKRKNPILPYFVCFGPYSTTAPVLFEAKKVRKNLSEILSSKGKTQLRLAETEKYAHVTFFFNSQVKEPYKGEKRILIPSPKVASYDKKPEMSAKRITSKLLKKLKSKKQYDLIIINFANCDLVGHSGKFTATKKAVETIDACLNKIVPLALKKGYETFITADHGNAEFMKYRNGDDCPAHTLNPVIFMYLNEKAKLRKGKTPGLKDIAPTILDVLNIKKPKVMTGKSLINKK